jgi:predicted nucleotidyltransferase
MAADRHINRKYTVDEIREILEPVFRKNGVKRAVLFGSYSHGKASVRSDIDILVDSQLRGLAFFGLLEDVVNALQKEVDLIDIRQIVENSRIQVDIDKNGVVIYAA